MKKRKKKIIKIILFTIGGLFVLFGLSFIPTLYLKTVGMNELNGEYITVYYEKEEVAAKDVFELVNAESERISKALGFDSPQNIKMYIYDYQSTFQIKKYGFIALLLNLDWYIGDNRGTNVLLTSPANPGKAHDYHNNKFASIHEMVHAYNSILNSKMPLWINEGLATFLTDSYKDGFFIPNVKPTIEQMHTSNPVEFSNIGGYGLSYTYIEFLDKTYGWER